MLTLILHGGWTCTERVEVYMMFTHKVADELVQLKTVTVDSAKNG